MLLRRRLLLPFLLAVAFIDELGYGVLAPMVPEIAERTGAGTTVTGVLVSSFAVGFLATLPAIGLFLRRHPSRSTLLVGLAVQVLAAVAFALADGLVAWTAIRVIQGAGAAVTWMSLLSTVLAVWPGRPGPRVGAIFSAYAVGAIVGPMVGALGGVTRPMLLLAALFAACLPAGALIVPRGAPMTDAYLGMRTLRDRVSLVGALAYVTIGFAAAVVAGVYPTVFDRLLSQAGIGFLLLALSIPNVTLAPAAGLVQGFDRIRRLLTVSVVVFGVTLGLVPVWVSLPAWVILLALAGAATAGIETTTVTFVHATTDDLLGPALVLTAGYAVGYAVGAPVAGLTAELIGLRGSGLVLLALCAVLGAAIWRVRVPAPRPEVEPAVVIPGA